MKWKKRLSKVEWKKWFAWFPVSLEVSDESDVVIVWLTFVERKWIDFRECNSYVYRLPK